MSRARTLASILGSDGALNAGDVSGLSAVATTGSATDLQVGTLPIARIADVSVTDNKIASLAAAKLSGPRAWTPVISVSGSTNYNISSNTWFQFSGYNFNGIGNFLLKASFWNSDGSAMYVGEHVGGPWCFDNGAAANSFGVSGNEVLMNGHGHTYGNVSCWARFNNVSTGVVRLELKYSYVNSYHVANGTTISILTY